MAGSTRYIYNELPAGEHLRLLTLTEGQNHERLAGSIQSLDLGEAKVGLFIQRKVLPSYITISYVWGSDIRDAEIELDGLPLAITTSASEVLRRLPKTDESTLVWIDGICINQDDIQERESQVAFMHKIYARAVSTFVWLGPEADDSSLAMRYIGSLDWHRYDHEWLCSKNKLWKSDDEIRGKSTFLDLVPEDNNSEQLLLACRSLLGRRWFLRIWIQQEVGVSTQVDVACGDYLVSFDQIWSMAWLFLPRARYTYEYWFDLNVHSIQRDIVLNLQETRTARRSQDFTLDEKSINGMPADIQDLARSAPSTFATTAAIEPGRRPWAITLIEMAWPAGASDPRDKIYAVREMVQETSFVETWIPAPSYTISWQELYVKVTKDFFHYQVRRNQGFTAYVSIMFNCAGIVNQHEAFELPSWVVDWRTLEQRYSLQTAAEWFAGGTGRMKFTAEQLSRKARLALVRELKPTTDICYHFTPRALALRTSAVLMDIITDISGSESDIHLTKTWTGFAPRFLALEQHALKLATAPSEQFYLTGQTVEDAYAHVLIGGLGSNEIPVNHESVLSQLQSSRQWLQDKSVGNVPIYVRWLEAASTFQAYKVCITQHNLLCLVPHITVVGDIVAIIRSVKRPVVLRPISNKYFLLVGSCYIHGFMENQAPLLIDEYKIKVKPDGTRSWRPEGDIRRNGLNNIGEWCHGEWLKDERIKQISIVKYAALVDILGDQEITIV